MGTWNIKYKGGNHEVEATDIYSAIDKLLQTRNYHLFTSNVNSFNQKDNYTLAKLKNSKHDHADFYGLTNLNGYNDVLKDLDCEAKVKSLQFTKVMQFSDTDEYYTEAVRGAGLLAVNFVNKHGLEVVTMSHNAIEAIPCGGTKEMYTCTVILTYKGGE